jgi:hypothetical protein
MSLKKMLDNHSDGPGAALLKASDLPPGTQSITIEVIDIREAPPGWGAPAIIEFKKAIEGKRELALNKTNHKAVMKKHGDDESALIGRKMKFDIISSRNPQTGEIVPSFAFNS